MEALSGLSLISLLTVTVDLDRTVVMFTGIIEATQKIIDIQEKDQAFTIHIAKPISFDDLQIGDSIAVNGVCLTVEDFSSHLVFTLGFETLKIMGWTRSNLLGQTVNLERSLCFGDRIHGHLVSGHADGTTALLKRDKAGECLILDFKIPTDFRPFLWKKGSIAINGVSLTLNEVNADSFSVCLIPETLKKTNLEIVQIGERVSFECDYFMKGFLNTRKYEESGVAF